MQYYEELETKIIKWMNLKAALPYTDSKDFAILEGIDILLRITIKILLILAQRGM